MNIEETLALIEQFEFANNLPRYVTVEDVSDSQVKISGKWHNVPYAWGILHKEDDYIFFETDDDNGFLRSAKSFTDEDSACLYAIEGMKAISSSLASKTSLELIVRFIMKECGYARIRAEEMGGKLSRHKEVFDEFDNYSRTKQFCNADGTQTEVCGYTAQKLFESHGLSPLGAYNYLAYLLEEPERGLEYLRKGIPRR